MFTGLFQNKQKNKIDLSSSKKGGIQKDMFNITSTNNVTVKVFLLREGFLKAMDENLTVRGEEYHIYNIKCCSGPSSRPFG